MMRPISAVIIVCLPLAHDLSITSLLSVIMALIAFTVVYENVTSLVRGAKFWEPWQDTQYPEDACIDGSHSPNQIGSDEVIRNGEGVEIMMRDQVVT